MKPKKSKQKDEEIKINLSKFFTRVNLIILLLIAIIVLLFIQKFPIDIDIHSPFWKRPIIVEPECEIDITCNCKYPELNPEPVEIPKFNWTFNFSKFDKGFLIKD